MVSRATAGFVSLADSSDAGANWNGEEADRESLLMFVEVLCRGSLRQLVWCCRLATACVDQTPCRISAILRKCRIFNFPDPPVRPVVLLQVRLMIMIRLRCFKVRIRHLSPAATDPVPYPLTQRHQAKIAFRASSASIPRLLMIASCNCHFFGFGGF